MKVKGFEVTEDVIERAFKWFPKDRSFTLSDLTGALIRLGVPYADYIANRAADRLLQKWRKAGTHTYSGGKWKRR